MADVKIRDLTAASALALTDIAEVTVDPSGTPLSRKATFAQIMALTRSGLTFSTDTADSNQNLAVNTFYYADISGFTADRDRTLPATCAVGDVVVYALKAGSTTREVLIKAPSGDTIIGGMGSITAAEYTRLFITGELMFFYCIGADSTWLAVDGCLPQVAEIQVSTQADGETANTVTLPTDTGGAHTVSYDSANMATTASGRITNRRLCLATVVVNAQSKDTITDGASHGSVLLVNGTESLRDYRSSSGSTANMRTSCQRTRMFNVDDYCQLAYISSAGAMGIRALSNVHISFRETPGISV